MRISSANTYDTTIETLQRRQSDLSDLQTRLTSGKRVLKASDDPAAAARAEAIRSASGALSSPKVTLSPPKRPTVAMGTPAAWAAAVKASAASGRQATR